MPVMLFVLTVPMAAGLMPTSGTNLPSMGKLRHAR